MRSLTLWRLFKAKFELQQGKKIKVVHSNKGSEYYGRYDETRHNLGPFVKYLQKCGIDAQYTMSDTSQHNGIVDTRSHTLPCA